MLALGKRRGNTDEGEEKGKQNLDQRDGVAVMWCAGGRLWQTAV